MEVAPDRSTRGDGWLIASLVLVFASVSGSLGALSHWKTRPGDPGAAPARWPGRTELARAPGRPTLLLFVSPSCPCSRASLHELSAITRGHEIDAVVVVGTGDDDAIVAAAREIPHARVVVDADNREAHRFGVLTSGHALLFAADGRCLYKGGITLARGHEGDNAGARAIVAALDGTPAAEEAPVYGCALAPPEVIR